MSTFKKRKVVRLSNNKKATIGSIVYNAELGTLDVNQNPDLENINRKLNYWTVQHLYFLSDEEIKEGDWYIHYQKRTGFYPFPGLRVQKCVGTNLPMDSKKIIATTDKSLKDYGKGVDKIMNTFNDTFADYLPQPSQSFIEKFVEEYNKGNQITEVLVEYEDYDWGLTVRDNFVTYQRLKINPKDNTITIRKAKDSWNREEVIELLQNCWSDSAFNLAKQTKKEEFITFDKWIEENL